MALPTRTKEYLLHRFRVGFRSIKTDVSLADRKTSGVVGTVASRMAFTVQQAAQHIVEQVWPFTVDGELQIDGVRLEELAGVHGVQLPPARKARVAAVVVGDHGGSNGIVSAGATLTVGGKTFERVEKLDLHLLDPGGLALDGDFYPGSTLGGDAGSHITWAFAGSIAAGMAGREDELSRWVVLEHQADPWELMVVRRNHMGTRGLLDVYPVYPRGYRAPDPTDAWGVLLTNARVVVFEATEAGFCDFAVGDQLQLDNAAATPDLEAYALEVDNGGDAMTTNEELATLLEMQLQGQAAGHNAQWWRELLIQNPHVAVRDAYVYPTARGPGSFDIVPIPQQGMEVPEISAEILQQYVRDNGPEDHDPRVYPCLVSPDKFDVWVVRVTPAPGYGPDPVGSFDFAPSLPPWGLGGVRSVSALVSTSDDTYVLWFPADQQPNNDWWGSRGSRMLFVQCGPSGDTQVAVVTVEGVYMNGAEKVMTVTSSVPLHIESASDPELVGWLYRYGNVLPKVAEAFAPGLAWPGLDTRGRTLPPGTTIDPIYNGQHIRPEIFLSATALTEGRPRRSTYTGRSMINASLSANQTTTPAAPQMLPSWPPYVDHIYRERVTTVAGSVAGVLDAFVFFTESRNFSYEREVEMMPALNLYEVRDVRILLDLAEEST